MTRCPRQVDVGAYLLDALEPDERERMQQHLVACPACSADLDELAALPTRLAAVPAADVTSAGPHVRRRASGRPSTASAARLRRWRRARAPTVAVALVLAVVAAGAVAVRSTDEPAPDVRTAASGAVRARAALTATRNGTRVVLTLAGVPAAEQCRLVGVSRRGQRQTAGTWTASPAGEASVTGWLSWHPRDVDRLVVETLDGAALLVLPPPRA